MEFRLDGESLAATLIPGEVDPDDDALPVRRRVALPGPRFGSYRLIAAYSVALPRLSVDKPAKVRVPLIMPGEGKLSQNRLTLTGAAELQVELRDDRWSVVPGGSSYRKGDVQPQQREELQLTPPRRCSEIELSVALDELRARGTTVIERAWVQTWLSDTVRRDRMAFSLTTNLPELAVELPEEAEVGRMQVLLDGKLLVVRTTADGRLVIPLSSDAVPPAAKDAVPPAAKDAVPPAAKDAVPRRHLLELRSHLPRPRPERGGVLLQMPRLVPDVSVRRVYWQLILPQNEHVISTPRDFTSEFVWDFNGLFWGRKPLLEQHQLERWIGAAVDDPSADKADRGTLRGTNRYLFSSIGDVRRIEVRTADRFWIVLLASLAALAAGLLLIHVPLVRRPGTLFVGGVVLLSIGVLYPEPTLLLAQAATLGLGLSLLAGLLQRSVVRRRRAAAFPETSSSKSSVLDTGSTQSRHPLPAAGNESSTQTSPNAAPPSQDPST